MELQTNCLRSLNARIQAEGRYYRHVQFPQEVIPQLEIGVPLNRPFYFGIFHEPFSYWDPMAQDDDEDRAVQALKGFRWELLTSMVPYQMVPLYHEK